MTKYRVYFTGLLNNREIYVDTFATKEQAQRAVNYGNRTSTYRLYGYEAVEVEAREAVHG